MTTQRQTNNWDFEVLNPIETKKLVGGGWGYIDEVVIWGDYNDWGNWWDNSGLYDPSNPYGNDGRDYGGGGSSDPSTPPSTHICTQLAGSATCGPMTLSYVANHFGGTGISSSDFAEFTGQNYLSMLAGQGGMSNSQMQAAVNTFFNNTIIDGSSTSYSSSLGAGNLILATIDQGGGIGHEVVITNFDSSTGEITYMDSVVGGSDKVNINTANFIGSKFAISGLKDNNIVDKYKNDSNDIVCSICGH